MDKNEWVLWTFYTLLFTAIASFYIVFLGGELIGYVRRFIWQWQCCW